jgi:hypothetical protein
MPKTRKNSKELTEQIQSDAINMSVLIVVVSFILGLSPLPHQIEVIIILTTFIILIIFWLKGLYLTLQLKQLSKEEKEKK